MGSVAVRCPETGEHVPTGVVMDPDMFEGAKLGVRTFVCDDCGKAHVWEKQDAILIMPDMDLRDGDTSPYDREDAA